MSLYWGYISDYQLGSWCKESNTSCAQFMHTKQDKLKCNGIHEEMGLDGSAQTYRYFFGKMQKRGMLPAVPISSAHLRLPSSRPT